MSSPAGSDDFEDAQNGNTEAAPVQEPMGIDNEAFTEEEEVPSSVEQADTAQRAPSPRPEPMSEAEAGLDQGAPAPSQADRGIDQGAPSQADQGLPQGAPSHAGGDNFSDESGPRGTSTPRPGSSVQGEEGNGDKQNELARPYIDLLNQAKEASEARQQHSKAEESGGAATDASPKPGSSASRPGSHGVQISPGGSSGPTSSRNTPNYHSMFSAERPPPLPPRPQTSPSKTVAFAVKGAEPVMAVGVARTDVDTTSIVDRDRVGGGGDTEGSRTVPPGDRQRHVISRVEREPCCRSRCCPRTGSYTVCAVGSMAVFSVMLCVVYFYLGPLVDSKIRESLILRPGMTEWQHPRAKMAANLYFFHIENPDAFLNKGEIPRLRQAGPYSYRLGIEKTNITWNDNSTVSYRERYSFRFDENSTVGSEDDEIGTVNLPLLALDNYLGAASGLVERLLPTEATRKFESRTVRELVWGYESLVLKEIKSLANSFPLRYFHLAQDLPSRVGIFWEQNSTSSRAFNVYTGAGNFSRLHQIYTWDYRRELPYWSTEAANAIRGTDGIIFKPFLNKSKLTFFLAHLFRKFDLDFQHVHTFHGLNTFRYIIGDSQFSNRSRALESGLAPHSARLQTTEAVSGSTISAPVESTSRPSPSSTSPSTKTSSPVTTSPIKISSVVTSTKTDAEREKEIYRDTQRSRENTTQSFAEFPTAPSGTDDDYWKGDNDDEDDRVSSTTRDDGRESGYCVPKCVPSGVYSIEPCTWGPIYVSLPHFLGADPFYLSRVSGLEPEEEKHRPIWDIDKVTGVTVYNRRRFQLNVKMDAGKNGQTFLPILWIDIEAEIDSDSLERLRQATNAKLALMILQGAAICIIGALFAVTITLVMCNILNEDTRRRYQRVPEV